MSRMLVCIVALCVGVVSILPYLLPYWSVDKIGENKFHFFYQDSELVYLSRIREVTEGNYGVTSPAFYEYKEGSAVQQPFAEWLYAIGAFGSADLVPIFAIVTKFLFPTLLFLVLYALVQKIMRDFNQSAGVSFCTSVFVAMLIVLGYEFNNIGFWKQVITQEFSYPMLSLWTRIVHPITGALGLFLASYLALTIEKRHNALRVISLGLLVGLLSGYIFSFAIAVLTLFIMLLFAIGVKNQVRTRCYFYSLIIAFVINIPYLLSTLGSNIEVAELAKNGLLLTHTPMHNKVLFIALAMFLVTSLILTLYNRRGERIWQKSSWQWMAATLLASVVSFNQQIITGKTIWPGHFVQYTIPISYVIFFTCAVILGGYIVKVRYAGLFTVYQKVVVAMSVLGTALIFVVNVFTFSSVYTTQEGYQNVQRYEPVIDWLRDNAPQKCVVFVVEESKGMQEYVPAYTHCDLYHSTYVFFSVPHERIMDNYILHLRLIGVPSIGVSSYLDSHESDIRHLFFNDWVDKFSDGNDSWLFSTKSEEERVLFMPNAKREIESNYARSVQWSLQTLLHKYAVTYIVFDSYMNASLNIEDVHYREVFERNGMYVLEVINE